MKATLSNGVLAMCLIAFLFIGSCTASRHAGVSLVKQPSLKELSEEVWLVYWQDQFDAKSGSIAPPSEEYPDAARRAYQKAKQEWDVKVAQAALGTWEVIGCVVAGLPLFLVLITN